MASASSPTMNSFGSLPVFFFASSISVGLICRLAVATSTLPEHNAANPAHARSAAFNLNRHVWIDALISFARGLRQIDHRIGAGHLDAQSPEGREQDPHESITEKMNRIVLSFNPVISSTPEMRRTPVAKTSKATWATLKNN